MERQSREGGWIVRSAASLDDRADTYMGLIGRVLAVAAGTTLILLAVDQLWRAIRKLG